MGISRIWSGLRDAPSKTDWLREDLKWRVFYWRLRKQECLNQAFDQRFGTDTAGEVALQEAGVSAAAAKAGNGVYRPLWRSEFEAALRLAPGPYDDFTFVDIGSGKGKAMLLASDLPFRRIVGIEYAKDLHDAAIRNLAIYRSETQRCHDIEAIHGDALELAMPEGPLVVLLFNSLDEALTRRFVARFEDQVADRAAPVYLIYANLRTIAEIGAAFDGARSLHRLHRDRRRLVFGNAAALRQRAAPAQPARS